MNSGRTVFSQLVEHLSHKEFQKCVARYGGDRYAKKLTCWQQFLAMAFAQLTYRESLRDIEACLGAVGGKLYHMGFGSSVARSTLADANENRDWRIYADFAHTLIATARQLYAFEASGVDLDSTFHRLTVSLYASSPRSVTLTQLRFTSLAVVSSREDFHLQDHAHAGRTHPPAP